MNACLKRLKVSLASGVRKVGSPVAPIVDTRVKFSDLLFFNFLDLDECFIVSLILLPSPPTNLLLPALNAFGANSSNDLVVFNIEMSGAAILLKPQMKRR